MGKLLSPEDYSKLVVNPIVDLYKSPDRGTRMALLEGLAEYESFVSDSAIREKIWPHLVNNILLRISRIESMRTELTGSFCYSVWFRSQVLQTQYPLSEKLRFKRFLL